MKADMGARRPDVSVVIPVLGDAERLALCLDALDRQTLPAARFEVIVADNARDRDEAVAAAVAAHAPRARLVHEPRPGSYAARNRGIADARGAIVAFTDADCVPRPDWLERGVAALSADPGIGLVGGRIEVVPRDPRRRRAAETYDLVFGFPQERFVRELGFAATANAFTRREVLAAVGPFRDDLQSGGDWEWGQRVGRSFKVAYAPDAVVDHPARATVRELATKQRRIELGRADLGLSAAATWPTWRFVLWSGVQMLPPVVGAPRLARLARGLGPRAALHLWAMRYRLDIASIGAVREARARRRSRR